MRSVNAVCDGNALTARNMKHAVVAIPIRSREHFEMHVDVELVQCRIERGRELGIRKHVRGE